MLMKIWVLDRNENVVGVLQNRGTPVILEAIERQAINKEHLFEFVVPADHKKAEFVLEENIVLIEKQDGGFSEFVIREVEEEVGEQITKRAFCEHVSAELLDTIIRDRRPESDAAGMLEVVLENTRWQGFSNITGDAIKHVFYNKSVLKCIHEIIELFGGELEFTTEFTGSKITGRYVFLHSQLGKDRGKRFVYGKDVTGITRTVDTSNLVTALIGRGKGVETEEGTGYGRKLDFTTVEWSVADGDPVDKPLGQDWVGLPEDLQRYGRKHGADLKHREGLVEFNDETDPERLLELTWQEYQKRNKPVVGYELDVIDLEEAEGRSNEAVRLGDTVAVIDRNLKPELRIKARVVEIERDRLNPLNNKVVVGNAYEPFKTVERQLDLEDDVRDRPVSTDWLEGKIDAIQNEMLAGGGTIHLNNDGQLILDKPADQNPGKAIFIGNGILGISNTRTTEDPATVGGWDFRSFITGDGVTADEINTGTLRANRIRGGQLTLGGRVDENSEPVNGHLWMYNEKNQVVIDMDGAYGGIHNLKVGHLSADNVTESTTPAQEKQTNYIYVMNRYKDEDGNIHDGSDIYGDGSQNNPYRTIDKAFSLIPRDNGADWVIGLYGVFYEHVELRGFRGDGAIKVYLMEQGNGEDSAVYGWVRISSCLQKFEFYGGVWIHDGTGHSRNETDDGHAIFHVIRSSTVWLEGMSLVTIGASRYNVAVSQNSFCYLRDCSFYATTPAYMENPVPIVAGVGCIRGSVAHLHDCYGVINGGTGLMIQSGSVGTITGDSLRPLAINGEDGSGQYPGGDLHPTTTIVEATRTGIYVGADELSGKNPHVPSMYKLIGIPDIHPSHAETWRVKSTSLGGHVDDGFGAQSGILQGSAYYPHLLDPDNKNLSEKDIYGGMNIGFVWFDQKDLDSMNRSKNPGMSGIDVKLSLKRASKFGKGKPAEVVIWAHSLPYPEGGLSSMPDDWDPLNDPEVNLRHGYILGEFEWGEKAWFRLPDKLRWELAGIPGYSEDIKGFAFYVPDYTQSAELDVDSLVINGASEWNG